MYFRKQDSSSSADTGHTDIPGVVLRPDRYTPPPPNYTPRSISQLPDRPVSMGTPPPHHVVEMTLSAPAPGGTAYPPGADIEMQPLGASPRGDNSMSNSASTHGLVRL